MELLSEPIKTLSATFLGALWVVTVIISSLIIRTLWNEIKELRKTSVMELAKKDEQLQKLNDARMTDMRSIDRLAGSVEDIGDKLLDIALQRGRQ